MYSQYEEEIHILKAVENCSVKRFLDIGAWNAKDKSNTRALFECGWSGVMIEPSPSPFVGLLEEYGREPRITLVHAAIGFERTMVKFHATEDAVSTFDQGVYDLWKGTALYQGDFYTPLVTIDEICHQFGGDFSFVNFDAEGISVDLFKRYLEIGPRPACMCVEHDNRLVECLDVASRLGYRSVYVNGTNIVFSKG